ncbi:flagellar hook-length control protein FliK [Variovorax sp. PBL-E5]|uniref:flagellar hook-length control protein FliK n=1 Tax=Variovorax sp. PBL-E5 TaxID=434014 RepID=UPI0013181E3E|nr:flagellar hook-length control protein FliK [Variovorax sp. PBL-E5]VTU33376.1 Flagellar hook-length control protein [Variovorax sp. PBL-E5]
MPSMILPAAPANVSGPAASPSGARGRAADDSQGGSFGAALDRVRTTAASTKTRENASGLPEAEAADAHKPQRAAGRKSELSAADVMALLAPAVLPVVAAPTPALPGAATPSPGAANAKSAPADGVLPQAVHAASQQMASSQDVATATPAADADPASKSDPAPKPDAAQDVAKAAQPGSPLDAGLRAGLAKTMPPSDPGKTTSAATPSSPSPALPAAANTAQPPNASAASSIAAAPSTANAAPANAAKTNASAPIEAATAKLAAAPEASAGDGADAASTTSPQPLPPLQALVPTAIERQTVTTNTTPVLTVAPPVGSSEWGTAIGHQMIRMSTSGQHVAELNLNPAGLGPLKVTLTLGDNQAQAMFVSAHESVRRAVEAALPQLRTTLADQGISLGQTSVGAEARQPGQGNAFEQQQPRPSNTPDYPGTARRDALAASAAVPAARPNAAHASKAGLDTFA